MKKILAFIIILVMSLAMLASCNGQDNSGGGNEGGEGESEPVDYGTATVFTRGMDVLIVPVSGDQAAVDLVFDLKTELENRGVAAKRGTQYNVKTDYEIIVGFRDSERPATVRAFELLERMDKDSYFDSRYLVYADSGTICIAYDVNEYTNISAMSCVAEKILDAIFTNPDYVAIAKGVIASGNVNLIQEQELLDKEQSAAEWAALEKEIARRATENSGIENKEEAEKYGAEIGKETVAAFRKFASMFGDDIVDWVANLYDSGVGAFYSSSSGRDGAEFGPDAENTVQLIRMLISSGMCDGISADGVWKDILPKEMQVRIAYFAKSIQSPDGYFYHPQWDRNVLANNSIRMSRDLGWCTQILSNLGYSPTYDVPSRNSKGDGMSADEFWELYGIGEKPYTYDKTPTKDSLGLPSITSGLGTGMSYAVSKAVSASDVVAVSSYVQTAASVADKYSSHVKFMTFLLDELIPLIKANPYSGGSTVGEAPREILDASKNLGVYTYTESDDSRFSKFDGMTIKEMVLAELKAAINPETGFWGDVPSGKKGTEYLYTNGFMKIMAFYTGVSEAYPEEYMVIAANSLIEGLLGDEPSLSNILETYNIWVGINRLVSNLNYISDAAVKAQVKGIINTAMDQSAAEAIINSYNKMSAYQKYDGGFSHYVDKGTATHSGLPVSSGANQSDNDATACTLSAYHQVYETMGLSSFEPTIYQESDWMRFLDIIFSQSPVVKYEYELGDIEPVLGYGDGLNELIVNVTGSDGSNNIHDIVEDGDNKMLHVSKKATGSNMSFTHSKTVAQAGANVAFFEMEIKVNSIRNGSNMELYLRGGHEGGAYSPVMILFNAVTDGNGQGDLKISDYGATSSGPYTYAFSTGEWVKFRVEYRTGAATGKEGSAEEIEYRVYANDKLILVSNRVWGKSLIANGGSVAVPTANKIERAVLLFNNNNQSDVYIDNTTLQRVYVESDGGIGTAPEIGGNEPGGSDTIVETFDEMPKDLTTSVVDGVTASIVEKGDGNKALMLDKAAQGTVNFAYKNVNVSESNAKVAVFNFDMLVENIEQIDAIEVYLSAAGTYIYLPYITFSGDSIMFRHNASSDYGMFEIGKKGEWISLTFKYFAASGADAAKYELYTNGSLVGTFSGTWKGVEAPAVTEMNVLQVIVCKKNVGDFYFDNVSIRHLDGTDDDYFLDNGGAPVTPKIETFDSMPQNLTPTLIDGVTADIVDKGDGNKALFIDKTVDGSGTTTGFTYKNVNYKEKNANVAVFGFDLLVENLEEINSLEIYPKAGDTKMFLAYLTILGKENGSNIVYRHNAGGEQYNVGKVGEWISLQFRVYENKLEVIADETLVGTFEGTWKSAAAVATSAYDNLQVTVCMQNKGDYYFDNLYLYHICDPELGGSDDSGDTGDNEGGDDNGSAPSIPVIPEGPEKPGADFNGYTFEDGKMPDGFTLSCNLPDNTATIVANGDGNKCIVIDKPVAGIVDGKYSTTTLGIKASALNAVENNANTTVISFDMLYTDVTAKGAIEFWMRDESDTEKALAYFTITGTEAGSAIMIEDLRNSSIGKVDSGIVVGTWASVKLVIDGTDGSWDLYANGNLVYSGLVKPGQSGSLISKISFSLDRNNSARCYIDNLYYAHVNVTDAE